MSTLDELSVVRTDLRPGDPDQIVELHRRVYGGEWGMNDGFVAGVAKTVADAVSAGWPAAGGGAWLVDRVDHNGLAGSLGLTGEGPGRGQVRWFVLDPELRGRGLGRRMLDELFDAARAQGLRELALDTYSDLRSAAHLYREAGFVVTREVDRTDWGPPITYQHYELTLT
jgi:ribosomal protein S18 acetylase RimI-like enzyme